MTDKVVDFNSRLATREAEYADFDRRMQRAGTMFRMMVPVIAQMRELGADTQAIARVLWVIVEELEASDGEDEDDGA